MTPHRATEIANGADATTGERLEARHVLSDMIWWNAHFAASLTQRSALALKYRNLLAKLEELET